VILVDTNVLIDVATQHPVWFVWSRAQLDNAALADEVLAINDIVYAEMSVRYPDVATLDNTLERIAVELVPTPREALFVAGRSFQRYRAAGGIRTGVPPDFFVGAHALIARVPLITRDTARYRSYFPGIQLIAPH
jgi:predicted nucleic acid-binding protein